MANQEGKTRTDRREVHSVYVPVPTIVLNTSAAKNSEQTTLTHSRSAGDLDMVLSDTDDFQAPSKFKGLSKLNSSMTGFAQDSDQSNALGLYCSPRMLRRSQNSTDSGNKRHSGLFIDSLNACSLNCLDPGSSVGSTVSLNSEYTARSVGLISNDSNSECSQNAYQAGVLDGSFHKHNVLKRFYSTPEKDEDLLAYQNRVRRNSKSMGNMQKEDMHNFVSFDFGSDSADDNHRRFDSVQDSTESCDIDNSLAARTGVSSTEEGEDGAGTEAGTGNPKNLVKAVTGSVAMRDSRIRKWLVEIRDPDDSVNS